MRSWKSGERQLAAILHCERVPVTGRHRGRAFADLISHWLSAEVKTRRRLPVFLADAMDSAERGAEYARSRDGRDRLPIVIVHADRTEYRNSLVVMRLEDASQWFGLCDRPPPEAASRAAR